MNEIKKEEKMNLKEIKVKRYNEQLAQKNNIKRRNNDY